MKTELPPWVAIALVVAVVLIVAAALYFGTGPGRQAKEMEDAINATVAKPGKQTPGPMAGDPGPPAGAAAGQPGSPSR